MRLLRRIEHLERHMSRPRQVSWEEYHAANERTGQSARAMLQAFLDHQPPPPRDEEQAARDSDTIRRWCLQNGFPAEPDPNAKERLIQMIKKVRAGMGLPPDDEATEPSTAPTSPAITTATPSPTTITRNR